MVTLGSNHGAQIIVLAWPSKLVSWLRQLLCSLSQDLHLLLLLIATITLGRGSQLIQIDGVLEWEVVLATRLFHSHALWGWGSASSEGFLAWSCCSVDLVNVLICMGMLGSPNVLLILRQVVLREKGRVLQVLIVDFLEHVLVLALVLFFTAHSMFYCVVAGGSCSYSWRYEGLELLYL